MLGQKHLFQSQLDSDRDKGYSNDLIGLKITFWSSAEVFWPIGIHGLLFHTESKTNLAANGGFEILHQKLTVVTRWILALPSINIEGQRDGSYDNQ